MHDRTLYADGHTPGVLALYAGLGYRRVGSVTFRGWRFDCFEKTLSEENNEDDAMG